jgi:hypothetical protein
VLRERRVPQCLRCACARAGLASWPCLVSAAGLEAALSALLMLRVRFLLRRRLWITTVRLTV